MIDLQCIEDEEERAKALSRRLEEDKKKALRVKEAEEKAARKEAEKLQKSQEKITKKGKKNMNPPSDPKSPPGPSPTHDSGSKSRGTKRDSSYEQFSQGIPIFTLGEEHYGQIGEWIKNYSLEEVLGGDTGSFSPLFDDLKCFISKVNNSSIYLVY